MRRSHRIGSSPNLTFMLASLVRHELDDLLRVLLQPSCICYRRSVHGIYVSDRLLIIFYVRLCKNTWYYCNNKFRIPSPQGWGVFKVLVFSDLWRIVSQYLLRYCVTCSQMCMIVQVLKNLVLHYNLKGVAMLAQTTLTCVASASNNSSVQAWWWQSLAKC